MTQAVKMRELADAAWDKFNFNERSLATEIYLMRKYEGKNLFEVAGKKNLPYGVAVELFQTAVWHYGHVHEPLKETRKVEF